MAKETDFFLETLKLQKAVRSWCQNSPQLAAWACQLHILVPKQKKNQGIKKIKENLYAYILFQLGMLRKKQR